MTRVKICGITNTEDLLKAVYYGASAVGFIFHKKSPRYVSPSKVKKLIQALPPYVTPVGVFVNQNDRAVRDVCRFSGIRTLQFHGDEEPGYCHRFKEFSVIKAFRVDNAFDPRVTNKYKVSAFLFDTYQEDQFGGTGKTFHWDLVKGVKFERPVVLSGGLTPENVKEAITTLSPYAVDVSSGVEKSPGIKEPRLIRAFFEALV